MLFNASGEAGADEPPNSASGSSSCSGCCVFGWESPGAAAQPAPPAARWGGIGQDVFALKGGVGVEQRCRIGLLLLQLAQIDIARQLSQRIGWVQLASGVSSSGWLPGLATCGGVTVAAAGAFGVNSSTRLSQISLGIGAADFSLAAAAGP